jgi:membrane associated rhomboid family serine protease
VIPLRDANPSLTTPIITIVLILAAGAVFFVIQPREAGADLEFTYENAAIACELTTGEPLSVQEINTGVCVDDGQAGFFADKGLAVSVLVSMFLHGGILHLGANMWSLWIFGNNVEDAFGRVGYIVLYLLSGVAATLGFVALNPTTTIPLVGASGAIAGVMGAYLVLFPRARVVSVFPVLFFVPIGLPAIVFLAIWFASQFAISGPSTGIAWEAHVAGFLAGATVAAVLRRPLLARVESHRLKPAQA